MERLKSYIGINPFTVEIDASPLLENLVIKARKLRVLPFNEKLNRTKELTLSGIPINAYELWVANEDEYAKNIVFSQHPLSTALKTHMGCCRYQGALFFALGYESELGDSHYLQAAPVSPGINTVFNQVINSEENHIISIFTESLKDKKHDYTVQNPNLFDQVFKRVPGHKMYSYHKTPEGLVILSNNEVHASSV